MKKKTCTFCLEQIQADSAFCPRCSAKQPAISTDTWTWVFISIIVVVIILVAGIQSNITSHSSPVEVTKVDYESDLVERCKDWVFYRNRAYKLGREGDQKGSEQARLAMQRYYDDLLKKYPDSVISATISKIEASGYKGGL